MKNLILFLIPLLFLGCKKDEMPIEVSEGTRLMKMEYFTSGQSLSGNPDEIRKFFYDDQERLIGMDRYVDTLTIPMMKYRKEYNIHGNLEKISSSKLENGNYELTSFYEFYTNQETQQIEKATKFFVPHEGGDPQKSYERHFIYNEYNQIVLDTISISNFQFSNQFPINFKYHWEENNVAKIEKYLINGKMARGVELKYDGKNNPDPSKQIKDLFMPRSAIIPVGLNNIIEAKYYDFTGSGPRRVCNPCRTTYKYNSSGFPYYLNHDNRYSIIYTYEKE